MWPVNHGRQFRNTRRGTMTIEMALLMPIMLLLTFATVEYAYIYMRVEEIHHAARVGARTAALAGPEANNWRDKIDDLMSLNRISNWSATVSPSATAPVGQKITVTVTVPCQGNSSMDIMGLGTGTWVPIPAQVRASVCMAKEG